MREKGARSADWLAAKDVVTGPCTDNQVGVEIITQQMGVPAFNAIGSAAELGDRVIEALGLAAAAAA